MTVQSVSSAAEFAEVLSKNEIVIVDFFAVWCGPCKMISPRFAQFAGQYTKAKFVQVDVDQVPEVAEKAGIRAMPTFHVYVKGEKKLEIVGADPRKLESAIQQFAA